MPQVSIIVPVYNGEKFIEGLFSCFNKQTFDDFEVVFVNDGSTDRTLALLSEICSKSSGKYCVFSQGNKGVSAARNYAIDNSRGKYITFVDVDDLITPNYLEMLMKYQNGKEDSISICSVDFGYIKRNESSCICSSEQVLEDYLFGRKHFGVWGALFPKKIFNENKIRFETGYKYSEDLCVMWKVLCVIDRINIIAQKLYIYRDIPNSAMSKINDSRLDSITLMQNLKPYVADKCPSFYEKYKKFAVPRMAWSLLWQASHYNTYDVFLTFIKKYDFKSDMLQLRKYPDLKVSLSARFFVVSPKIFYYLAKIVTRNFRKNEKQKESNYNM